MWVQSFFPSLPCPELRPHCHLRFPPQHVATCICSQDRSCETEVRERYLFSGSTDHVSLLSSGTSAICSYVMHCLIIIRTQFCKMQRQQPNKIIIFGVHHVFILQVEMYCVSFQKKMYRVENHRQKLPDSSQTVCHFLLMFGLISTCCQTRP